MSEMTIHFEANGFTISLNSLYRDIYDKSFFFTFENLVIFLVASFLS